MRWTLRQGRCALVAVCVLAVGGFAALKFLRTGPTAGAGNATCMKPSYQTSAQDGMWNLAPYFVANDMWGAGGYNVSQTLYGCSHSDWYVVATMDNNSGNGAVKTYPNSHRDFDNAPQVSSLSAVMIWTENHGQVPSGGIVGSVTLGGRSYTVWRSSTGRYVAFVAKSNFTAGKLNLLDFFQWLMGKGWIPANTTLNQVDYGAELVSTSGVPATFTFSNFSVNAS